LSSSPRKILPVGGSGSEGSTVSSTRVSGSNSADSTSSSSGSVGFDADVLRLDAVMVFAPCGKSYRIGKVIYSSEKESAPSSPV
jgi:hypothetical protein